MRLAFLTPEYPTPSAPEGGLANYTRKTTQALVKLGHRVDVYWLSDKNQVWQDRGVTVREIKKTNLKFLPVPLRRIITSFRLRQLVYRQQYDLVHTTSFLYPGIALLPLRKLPVVCRVSSSTSQLRRLYGSPSTLLDSFSDWLEKLQVTYSDAAFAPSRYVASMFVNKHGPVNVIHTLASPPSVSKDASKFAPYRRSQYFLYFGNLSPIKGTDLLADSINTLSRSHPSVHFIFIGRDDGFPDGRKIMDYIYSKNPATGRIHYLPPLAQPQLIPFIKHALAVVIPSRADNYPNACLESFYHHTPVIGSTQSSLDELVSDNLTGFLFKNGSSASLSQALLRAIRLTPQQRSQLSLNIRAKIKDMEKENPLQQLLDIYKSAINRFHGENYEK